MKNHIVYKRKFLEWDTETGIQGVDSDHGEKEHNYNDYSCEEQGKILINY